VKEIKKMNWNLNVVVLWGFEAMETDYWKE